MSRRQNRQVFSGYVEKGEAATLRKQLRIRIERCEIGIRTVGLRRHASDQNGRSGALEGGVHFASLGLDLFFKLLQQGAAAFRIYPFERSASGDRHRARD